jgi:hypothetical protein
MFDPDVLDPLVKEHGIDKYGLIIRYVRDDGLDFRCERVLDSSFSMDLLAGIALYEDIATYEQRTHSRYVDQR